MDREAAIKATKNGAIAACISAALTLAFMAFAIGTDTSGKLALWNDPSTVIDVILILACAFGIYKKNLVLPQLCFLSISLVRKLSYLWKRNSTAALGLLCCSYIITEKLCKVPSFFIASKSLKTQTINQLKIGGIS